MEPEKKADELKSEPVVKPGWKDPECPKCGLKLCNKMFFCCPHGYCPAGLN